MSLLHGLIGHEKVVDVLLRMMKLNTLPHALLVVGPESVGKTRLIEGLIQTLFHTDGSIDVIPDVVRVRREVDVKTEKRRATLSVEQIRACTQRLAMTPILGSWKIGFIEEADALSASAANALLKTLEEPKGKTVLILRAATLKEIPATIVSRCQVIRLYSVPTQVISAALMKQGLSKTDAWSVASQAFGRPGRARSFVTHSTTQSEAQVHTQTFLDLLTMPLEKQFGAVSTLVSKDEQNKTDELRQLLDHWEPVLRDVLLIQQACPNLCTHPELEDRTQALAQCLSPKQVRLLFERMKQVRFALRSHINAHLSLEHILLSTNV